MPELPVLSADELAVLPRGELAVRLAQAYRLIAVLGARVEELERQAAGDSSNSSRPPSSDSPYRKQPRDRSLRERGKRRPGKQPGSPGATMGLVDDPDEVIVVAPACCRGCGADLSGQPAAGSRRHQVTDIVPPPPPVVTEYAVRSVTCPDCGTRSQGAVPAHARARASYGPRVHAQAAYLLAGHFLPVARAALLLREQAGPAVSAGWMAGVCGKAAVLITASGFAEMMAGLLRQAPAVHADETPARAAGGLRYVHVACTRYLTLMHTGDRSRAAIDAGAVLPGYDGILVRDGYSGYGHLTSAAHAWCGAHLLRDLQAVHDTDPAGQDWAAKMGCLLLHARDLAAQARRAGQDRLSPAVLEDLRTRYRDIADQGFYGNIGGRAAAQALAKRFTRHQAMILRFITRPDLDIFTNNEAERTIRCVKVQQRTSGGCWRTLQGLADFAIIQSYLSTAAKWGTSKLDALTRLFTGNPWTPPAFQPSG